MFGRFMRRSAPVSAAADIYARIVAQARLPAFYRDFGAPDTLPGRFEMVVLHASLYFHRLRKAGPEAREAGQEVFDVMFRSMDDALREIGVGDVTVPKRMRAMIRAFYDGAGAYDAALDARDDEALARALARNVYGAAEASQEGPARLAAYARRAADSLAGQPLAALLTVGPDFPQVEGPDA